MLSFAYSWNQDLKKKFDQGGNSLREVVEQSMSGHDYEQGALEDAQKTADNCREFLGYLSLLLVEKGIITKEDLAKVLEGKVVERD